MCVVWQATELFLASSPSPSSSSSSSSAEELQESKIGPLALSFRARPKPTTSIQCNSSGIQLNGLILTSLREETNTQALGEKECSKTKFRPSALLYNQAEPIQTKPASSR